MVVMFLFYSGYGILESYRKKRSYLSGFLMHRVLKTLVTFDVAVLLFVILALVMSKDFSAKEYALSFIAWESIGNSNWFVFDIIVLWLFTWFGLRLHDRYKFDMRLFVILIYGCCLALIVFLFLTKRSSWWYDTVMAFPTGMLYSVYKNKIERFLGAGVWWWTMMITCVTIFLLLYVYAGGVGALINSILFPLIVVFLTIRVKIDNAVLRWLGVNCFAIYILQRLPMIIFTEIGFNENGLLFSAVVIPATLAIAVIFNFVVGRLNRRLFG